MSLTLVFGPERAVAGWYDVTKYSAARCDLRRTTASASAGSPTLAGVFLAGDGDAGKRAYVIGAGATLLTRADGAMSTAVPYQLNIVTSALGGFNTGMIGRQITILGAGPAGVPLITKVWGIISSTQLRTTANCSTTVTGATYVIAEDLYAAILASDAASATLDTNAGTAVTSLACYVSTDDQPEIQVALAAALADDPRADQSASPTIFFPRPFGIGDTIEISATDPTHCRMALKGEGLQGTSQLLAQGSVYVRALNPKLDAFIRFGFGGTGSGLGIRGSITSGLKILTDPDASWVAGDVGKRIEVVGAGVQVGSTTQISLKTTIQSVDSPTQVTLVAAASTTVVEGIYSWVGTNVQGVTDALVIEKLHLMGAAGQKCGIHTLAVNGYESLNVTVSDFLTGIGQFQDGNPANTQCLNYLNSQFNTCRIGCKVHEANIATFNGRTMMDGNSNLVAVVPGPGTIGLDCNGASIGGVCTIQAYETWISQDGGTGSATLDTEALNLEAGVLGINMRGTGVNGGKGSVVKCVSFSTSGTGGAGCKGLVEGAGVQSVEFTPGYYLPANIDMYGGCDATALLDTILHDPTARGKQAVTYAASFTPDMALGKTITMLLTGNVTTIGAPLRGHGDATLRFIFLQDGTGIRTVAGWNAIYKVLNWVPNTGAGKRNTIDFIWDGTNWVQSGAVVQT